MQKLSFILFFLIFIFVSCQEIKKRFLPAFNVNIPDIKLSLPPIKFVSKQEVPIGALKAHINLDSTIKANTAGAFGASSVTSVKVKKVVIKVNNPDRQNSLQNFETARMTIYSNIDTTSANIAVINFANVYSDSLVVTPDNSVEISNYLKGSELGYNLFWKNRRTTSKSLKITLSVTLSVQ